MPPTGMKQQRVTRRYIEAHVVFPNGQGALAHDDELVVAENPVGVCPFATAYE